MGLGELQEERSSSIRCSGTLHSSRGNIDLHYQKWEPANLERETKKVIALIHGFGDHSGHYKTVVDHFVPLQFTVYGFDYRGHGKSEGKKGHINSWDELRHDMHKFFKFLQEIEVGKDLFIFSNGAGGVVVLDFLLRNPAVTYGVKGLIVSGLALSFNAFSGWMKGVLKASSIVAPKISIDVNIKSDHLSGDSQMINQTDNDPLVNSTSTPRFFSELLKTGAWVDERASLINVPLLMLQGGEDPVVSKETNIKFFRSVTNEDKKIYVYPGARHEPFNDVCRELVLDHMEKWISEHINITTSVNELLTL